MNLQEFSREEMAAAPLDMMAAWRASGGAVEMLDAFDGRAVRPACGHHGDRYDDGLRATMNTALASCADDDLRAGGPTHVGMRGCPIADDGLHATMNTALASCADDGLYATVNTALASCVDDGLRTISPTSGYCF